MTKETSEEKLLRYIRRTSLNEVRDMYFNTTWTSYKQLKEYFKESGWTRGELIAADRPGKNNKNALFWYLSGLPHYYEPIPQDELEEFEQKICNNLPTIVVTWHGPYESEVLYNPTFKRLLRCVRESIYVNKDPDHRGVGCLPRVEIFNDGGINCDIEYQLISFCLDS